MPKLIELHILQSFAPANLNRDDTGAPKDCLFGGARRARVSSQCIKRAVRRHFADAKLLGGEELGKRTRLVRDEIATRLAAKGTSEQAQAVAAAALEAVGLKVTGDGETQYLVFWGPDEMAALVELAKANWAEFVKVAPAAKDEEVKRGKAKKGELAKGVSDKIKELAGKVLTLPKAADVALFGRMLADLPTKNVDAACQVAHAFSTHKTEMEMDYFTAVDDLQKRESEEGAGAGMIGTVSFNAATFYRYANIHLGQLEDNLQGDKELARRAVRAFIQASIEAVPSGKQNTFAAYNPPSFALALVRDGGMPMSLANAFETPVRADRANGGGFVQPSIAALDKYWGGVAAAYGVAGVGHYLLVEDAPLEAVAKAATRVNTITELVDKTARASG